MVTVLTIGDAFSSTRPISAAVPASGSGGVCIFDIDMTLTCGAECGHENCSYADPAVQGRCIDTVITRGHREGFPLRFNAVGAAWLTAWCASRGFAIAIATHGSETELSHRGECADTKLTYVLRLLGFDGVAHLQCADVRALRTDNAGSRCVFGALLGPYKNNLAGCNKDGDGGCVSSCVWVFGCCV